MNKIHSLVFMIVTSALALMTITATVPQARAQARSPTQKTSGPALRRAEHPVTPQAASTWSRILSSFGLTWEWSNIINRGTTPPVSAFGDIWIHPFGGRGEERAMTQAQRLRAPLMVSPQRILALSADGLVDFDPSPAPKAAGSSPKLTSRKFPSELPVASILELLAYSDASLLVLTVDGCLLRVAESDLSTTDKSCGSEQDVLLAQRSVRGCGDKAVSERSEGEPVQRIDIALFEGRKSSNITRQRKERRNTDARFALGCSRVLFVSSPSISD
jgi:hypothetical protein